MRRYNAARVSAPSVLPARDDPASPPRRAIGADGLPDGRFRRDRRRAHRRSVRCRLAGGRAAVRLRGVPAPPGRPRDGAHGSTFRARRDLFLRLRAHVRSRHLPPAQRPRPPRQFLQRAGLDLPRARPAGHAPRRATLLFQSGRRGLGRTVERGRGHRDIVGGFRARDRHERRCGKLERRAADSLRRNPLRVAQSGCVAHARPPQLPARRAPRHGGAARFPRARPASCASRRHCIRPGSCRRRAA